MTKPCSWFATWVPLIKIAQAICHLIVIVLFIDGREQWWFYNTVFLTCSLAAFFCFFSILVRFFELNGAHMVFNVTDFVCNAILTIVCFSISGILIYDIWNMRQGPSKFKYHARLAPVTIGHDAWIRRCAVASCVLLLAAILYTITFLKLRRTC